jgi:ParB family transcriptional regulator, chromosome partitioning protein
MTTTGNVARDAGESENKEKAERGSAGRTLRPGSGQASASVPAQTVPIQTEKRRALGRGLESLLPGPRVVGPNTGAAAGKSPLLAKEARSGAPSSEPAGMHQSAVELRSTGRTNTSALTQTMAPGPIRNDDVEGDRFDGVIRAEADPEYLTAEEREVIAQQSHRQESPSTVAQSSHPVATDATVERRSATRAPTLHMPATVPTYLSPDEQQVPHRRFAPVRNDITPASVRNDISAGSEYGIEIMAMAESRTPSNLVINLGLEQIDKNPFQTRYVEDNDNLEELAESIKASGVVQPIVVRPSKEDGRFILILGERRLHASKKAGKETIPALVRRVSDQQAAEMTVIENLQREDLSPLEQAQAFKMLSQEFEMTQQQIGERVGLARQSVTNYMRLLKLPRDVMQLLAEKKLSFEKAKALLSLSTDDQIQHAALFAVKNGMNIEQIETLVLSMSGDSSPFPGVPGTEKKKSGARWVDPNVRSAQVDLERLLGVRVRIRDRKGKGKIVIEYSTVDDYERVVGMLRGK